MRTYIHTYILYVYKYKYVLTHTYTRPVKSDTENLNLRATDPAQEDVVCFAV